MAFKLNKPRETFQLYLPIPIERSWMVGLTNFQMYNAILDITHTNNNFELYADTFDGFSFAELNGELEEIVNFSYVSNEHLQDEKLGPLINSAYKKLETEKRQTDG